MALQLISKAQCPFCWQVKIALQYFDIDYQLREWKQPDKELLLRHSPQASSPILLDNGFAIWDSFSIIYYLEDIARNSKTLFPGNPEERAKSRLLHTYNNSIAGKSLREVIFEKRSKEREEWDWQRIEHGEHGWRKTLDWLEAEIELKESFLSVGFSIADTVLLPRFGLAEYYDVGVDERHPNLFNWFRYWKNQKLYMETFPWQ